jgi:predicted nucleotidyltransferase
MEIEELLIKRREQILAARRHGAYDVRIFGSVARS